MATIIVLGDASPSVYRDLLFLITLPPASAIRPLPVQQTLLSLSRESMWNRERGEGARARVYVDGESDGESARHVDSTLEREWNAL